MPWGDVAGCQPISVSGPFGPPRCPDSPKLEGHQHEIAMSLIVEHCSSSCCSTVPAPSRPNRGCDHLVLCAVLCCAVQVVVINEDTVNAFVLPGGKIVVFTGMQADGITLVVLTAMVMYYIHQHGETKTRCGSLALLAALNWWHNRVCSLHHQSLLPTAPDSRHSAAVIAVGQNARQMMVLPLPSQGLVHTVCWHSIPACIVVIATPLDGMWVLYSPKLFCRY